MKSKTGFWLLALLLFIAGCKASSKSDELAPISGLGGDFQLIDFNERPFHFSDLRGKTVLLFFGYTACPDACPTTMARLTHVYEELKKKGIQEKVKTVFISVDPKRDTPEKLAQYLSYFGVNTIGVTGKEEELAAVAKQFGATFEYVPTKSEAGYLVNHTTYVYLIDGTGRVRRLIRTEDPIENVVGMITKVASEGCCKSIAGP